MTIVIVLLAEMLGLLLLRLFIDLMAREKGSRVVVRKWKVCMRDISIRHPISCLQGLISFNLLDWNSFYKLCASLAPVKLKQIKIIQGRCISCIISPKLSNITYKGSNINHKTNRHPPWKCGRQYGLQSGHISKTSAFTLGSK